MLHVPQEKDALLNGVRPSVIQNGLDCHDRSWQLFGKIYVT